MGRGFSWGQRELNAFMQLFLTQEPSSLMQYPPGLVIQSLGREYEEDLFLPADVLTGHTLIYGTTGSGKSTLLTLIILQALWRREAVIILDPKSDGGLMSTVYDAAQLLGRGEELHFLDVGGTVKSSRLNPLSGFKRTTEIADRLTAAMSDTGSAMTFKGYAQLAVSAAAALLQLSGQTVTIAAIKEITAQHQRFISDLDDYLRGLLKQLQNPDADAFYRKIRGSLTPDEAAGLDAALNHPGSSAGAAAPAPAASDPSVPKQRRTVKKLQPDLLQKFYQWLTKKGLIIPDQRFFTVLDVCRMNAEFYAKVTAALQPRLALLSNTDLASLLSDSTRSITVRKIVEQQGILYAALNALGDSQLCAELGKLIMADLRAAAGTINARNVIPLKYRQAGMAVDPAALRRPPARVSIIIDEASEIIDQSTVQILNKGRSCGMAVTLATQSYADLAARLGHDGAQQTAANCNTLISLRIFDHDSAAAVAGSIMQVPIEEPGYSISFGEVAPGTVSYGGGKNVHLPAVPLVTPALLAALPDFEYVARLGDGRVVQGRVPIIKLPEADECRQTEPAPATELEPAVRRNQTFDTAQKQEKGRKLNQEPDSRSLSAALLRDEDPEWSLQAPEASASGSSQAVHALDDLRLWGTAAQPTARPAAAPSPAPAAVHNDPSDDVFDLLDKLEQIDDLAPQPPEVVKPVRRRSRTSSVKSAKGAASQRPAAQNAANDPLPVNQEVAPARAARSLS